MSARMLDSDLARARAAFDTWRPGRGGRGRIPDHLWQMATALLDEHALASVAHALGLNPGRLRARLAEQHPAPKRSSLKPAFGELRALDLVPGPGPTSGTTVPARLQADLVVSVRIDRPDGARLSLSLPAGRGLLDEVCAAFLRA